MWRSCSAGVAKRASLERGREQCVRQGAAVPKKISCCPGRVPLGKHYAWDNLIGADNVEDGGSKRSPCICADSRTVD